MRKNFPSSLFFLLLTILILHALATYFYWYWSIWWFDILMHLLGGFWVGGVALWFYFLSGRIIPKKTNNKQFFIISLVASGLIGFLWEAFEFSLGKLIIVNKLNSLTDTLSDLTMDILGAILVALYFISKRENLLDKQKNKEND